MRKTLFLGGGNMAFAIIGGMLKQGTPADTIHVIEINAQARQKLSQLGVYASESWSDPQVFDQVLLAVKPQVMQTVLQAHADRLKQCLLISIAAGVSINQLSAWSGHESGRIARTMPNTPALVGQGMTGVYFAPECSTEDKQSIEQIFSACGQVVTLDKEDDINRITAISGSGPGYVFYLMEALETAAKNLGFSAPEARLLVSQTFYGAASLARQSEDSFATLREKVTSKGGTTFAGLEAMRTGEVAQSIEQAAQAALARALELQSGA